MATDNNIKTFTAIDIEKYHTGLLSNKERHELEKAAMDDPFLADALEGYAVAGVNATADIADLKKRLAQRTEEAKVIPLNARRNNNFKLFRAAVVIAFVAGAAFLVYQFSGDKNKKDIAQNNAEKKETIKATDSVSPSANTSSVTEESKKATTISTPGYKKDDGTVSNNDAVSNPVPVSETKETVGGSVAPKEKTVDAEISNPAPGLNDDASKTNGDLKIIPIEKNREEKDFLARQKSKDKPGNALKKETQYAPIASEQQLNKQEKAANLDFKTSNRSDDQYRNQQQSNIFRGRITDVNNVGVPFANVTNPQDNVGTYSDARGYFNLTYPDSVLNVQVRSIGFENNAVQLRNNVSSTQIVLQDDRKSLSEIVVSNQKPNAAARSRESNIKIEESEPTDGWDNYDAYLANNLNVPEDIKTKQSANTAGSVQVSFEVDKNGEPINMKVEKSLCPKCDEEAKRLIKDGPKWKQPASKKGRTKVTINF
jgi:CarboxypepD_reg-like domain/Gram-negative bacterial TonB protein C-terminal